MTLRLLLGNLLVLISCACATAQKQMITQYPSGFIHEIYFTKADDAAIKDGDYYSFYDRQLATKDWQSQKIDEDKIKGIQTRGFYAKNVKDSIWTLYYSPEEYPLASVNEIKEEGWYINDKKAGIWYSFFEEGKVQKRYDFDEKRELETIVKPRFIYPAKAQAAGVEGLVAISITYKNCIVDKYKILKDIGYGCGDAVISALKEAETLKAKYGINQVDCSKKDEVFTTRFSRKKSGR